MKKGEIEELRRLAAKPSDDPDEVDAYQALFALPCLLAEREALVEALSALAHDWEFEMRQPDERARAALALAES